MSPPSDGAVPPPPDAKGGLSQRAKRLAALAAALALVMAGVAGYVLYTSLPSPNPLTNLPPRVLEVLANGSTLLEVPLLTIYTAPAPQTKGFETNMSFSFSSAYGGPSTTFRMHWGNVSGTAETVHFSLLPSEGPSESTAFQRGARDEFLALPAGNCSSPGDRQGWAVGISGTDIQQVYYERWRMNYTVVRMTQTIASVEERWIQVNYSLTYWGSIGADPPIANTTAPSAADLVPVGGVMEYNLSRGGFAGALASVRDILLSPTPFRHASPPVVLRAGRAGNLTAVLSSEFQWGPADGYWLGWSLTAQHPQVFDARYYVDARFGSLTVEFLPVA